MFSDQTRHYFQTAEGFGALELPDAEAQSGDPQSGHFFRVQLRTEAGRVRQLSFCCPRCLPAIACGGYLHHALVGETLERASAVTSQEILDALGGLPLIRSFYAWMAADALQSALRGLHA